MLKGTTTMLSCNTDHINVTLKSRAWLVHIRRLTEEWQLNGHSSLKESFGYCWTNINFNHLHINFHLRIMHVCVNLWLIILIFLLVKHCSSPSGSLKGKLVDEEDGG